MAIKGIDSHVHIWDLSLPDYGWPTPELKPIFKSFFPSDYMSSICDTFIKKGILVQVRETIGETDWMLEICKKNTFFVGVVGYMDLTDPDLEKTLCNYTSTPEFVGVRNILEGEHDAWLGMDTVCRGLGILERFKLPYDLLIRPRHFKLAADTVDKFPGLTFIVDHLAKPDIRNKKIDEWRRGMAALAKRPNVYCKISGLTTEADMASWQMQDLSPYVVEALSLFGTHRCMYGSDWPVCTMATSYQRWLETIYDILLCTSEESKQAIFHTNAADVYGLHS